MSAEFDKKPVKVALWMGGGPEPGYAHSVIFLSVVSHEYWTYFPLDGQRKYIQMQVEDLAGHADPTHSTTLSIGRVETFYELRDKGGGLGPKTNLRMYFDVVKEPHPTIRLLGFDNKKNDGQIYEVVKDRILRRQRQWNQGRYPHPKLPKSYQDRVEEREAKKKGELDA